MGQQISVEAAFPIFRQRCGELADENLLLRAQISELESHVEELQAENERLKADQPSGAEPPSPFPLPSGA